MTIEKKIATIFKRKLQKKTDLKRFQDLKFISQTFLSLISNPVNHFLSACFFEAIYKFARVDDPNINSTFANIFSSANYQPQIIIP